MILRFSKYEGLGNDFLVVAAQGSQDSTAKLESRLTKVAARLCDRHFGVGGDGILLVRHGEGDPSMVVINADGSRPEMCGNGLRCVALYLVERNLTGGQNEFVVQTDAGPHAVSVQTGQAAQVRVHMRPASIDAGEVLRDRKGPWVDQLLEGTGLNLTMVSMGNPHAVTFDAVQDMATLGPRVERDSRFRAGANVGFAQLRSPTALDLTVWERGVGFTLACGTGACAAAVAAVESGRSPRGQELTVKLPGGPLRILVGEHGTPIQMTGPARHVFDGEVALDPHVGEAQG